MNDGKIIIDKIIEMAEQEASQIRAKAQDEVDTLLKGTKDRVEREQDKFDVQAQQEIGKIKAKEVSGAELKGKMAVLEEKQKLIEEVIAQAQQKLESLPETEYAQVIRSMIERLDKANGTEIILSEKDKEKLRTIVEQSGFTLLEETRNIDSGFVVKNGDIEYNYSFASIILIEQEDIRQIIAKILF